MIRPIIKTDYSDADRRVAAAMGTPASWINVYLVDGALAYGVTVHESQPLAALLFQVDAEDAGVDIEGDDAVWVGAVEYVADEGDEA